MPNYENGKIYEITGTDENGNKLTYIGSTTEFYLSTRLAKHIHDFKNDVSCSSKEVLKCKDYRINLIESYSCKTKDELKSRERFYSDNNKCVNKNKPILFASELQKYIHTYSLKYYKQNKEKINKQSKEYYEEHKEQSKEYYEEHKEQLKQYRHKNKEQKKIYDKQYRLNKKVQKKELELMSKEDKV